MPLILPVDVIANTPYEVLESHIKANSLHPKWVTVQEPHGRTAIICGSGPSLSDTLDEILSVEGDLFALNIATKYLNDNGIIPDYQVMVDAKEESLELIGKANNYYFGSTINPGAFKQHPDATLFQIQVDEKDLLDYIDSKVPDNLPSYAYIATDSTVGAIVLSLAYSLGYRKMKLYGYDSCHREDESHVCRQEMNDKVPFMKVFFNNKEYTASLPMKIQAERIIQVIQALTLAGCDIEVKGSGLLPDIINAPPETISEREKYLRMWAFPPYRDNSPGEQSVSTFMDIVQPQGQVIDFGCGTGRASLRMKEQGLEPYLIDFVPNSRDPDALELPFLEWDLTEPFPLKSEYGFCVDVMEHIPSKDIPKVIDNIMNSANKVFFQISTREDVFGSVINQTLHMTVKDHLWWLAQFSDYRVTWQHQGEETSQFVVEKT